jgi:hypothetical protein
LFLAITAVAVAVTAGCDKNVQDSAEQSMAARIENGSECDSRSTKNHDTFVVVPDVEPPCRIRIHPTGVQLVGDGGNVPSPAPSVAIDSRGRYITALGAGGGLAVWSAKGQFVRRVGRVGIGPGEFAKGWLGIFLDADNNIVARDNSSNFLFFDSSLVWRRSLRVPVAAIPTYAHLVEDDRLLVSHPIGSTLSHYFELVELGEEKNSGRRYFGNVPGLKSGRRTSVARATTYLGQGLFWAAPFEGSASGYRLEKWSIDGEVKRVVDRPVSWFPKVYNPHQAGIRSTSPPPPHIKLIHAFADGLVFVVIRVNLSQLQDELYDWRFEVVDTEAGAIVASNLADRHREIPYMMFPSRSSGYLFLDDSPLSDRIVIIRLMLEPRE